MCAGKLLSLVEGQGEEECGECERVNCYHWHRGQGKEECGECVRVNSCHWFRVRERRSAVSVHR